MSILSFAWTRQFSYVPRGINSSLSATANGAGGETERNSAASVPDCGNGYGLPFTRTNIRAPHRDVAARASFRRAWAAVATIEPRHLQRRRASARIRADKVR